MKHLNVYFVPHERIAYGEGSPSPYIEASVSLLVAASISDTGKVRLPPTLKPGDLRLAFSGIRKYGEGSPSPYIEAGVSLCSAGLPNPYGEGSPSPYIEASCCATWLLRTELYGEGSPSPYIEAV